MSCRKKIVVLDEGGLLCETKTMLNCAARKD